MNDVKDIQDTVKFAVSYQDVKSFIESLCVDHLHAKQIESTANSTYGVLYAGELGVNAIGHGLAAAKGLNDKHAIKQTDRFLSNPKIVVWNFFTFWVKYIVGPLTDILVNLDWTDFDGDNQKMLVASLQTAHGRTIPLVWKTVLATELKGKTNLHEFEVARKLKQALPPSVHATIVADRGFADPELYKVLNQELGFDFAIRFKANINITDRNGKTKLANDWIGSYGRMVVLRQATMTEQNYDMNTIVIVCAKGMKEMWCIASSLPTIAGRKLLQFYQKRFTIEEMFRDIKDLRFGIGMSWTSVAKPERRDRLFMLSAIALALLTLLGQAGEDTGLDRLLKPNTVKRRVYSLVRQGFMWFERLDKMPMERYIILMTRFSELILKDAIFGLAVCKK